MKWIGPLSLFVALLFFMTPALGLVSDHVGTGIERIEIERGTCESEDRSEPVGIIELDGSKGPVYYLDDMVRTGAARRWTISDEEMDRLGYQPVSLNPMAITSSGPWATKDENDAYGNATELEDGDVVNNNVTSKISGSNLIAVDQDFYLFNLSVDYSSNQVDRLNVTVSSTDAYNRSAFVFTQAQAFTGYLQDQNGNPVPDILDTEVVGGPENRTRYIDVIPETSNQNGNIFVYLIVRSYNATSINYTLSVDITSVSRTEWNGLFNPNACTLVNKTNLPARYQSIDQAHDWYDWYNLAPYIQEQDNYDMGRGDKTEVSFTLDIAIENRGAQKGYMGDVTYDQYWYSAPISTFYFIYHNYTAHEFVFHQVSIISPVFGPLTTQIPWNRQASIGMRGQQIDGAWFGFHSEQYWLWTDGSGGGQIFDGAEVEANVQFNLTNFNVKLIPPNDPPQLDGSIPSFTYYEDEGPWVNVSDLEDYFFDNEHDGDLRFEVERGQYTPYELELKVEDSMLSIHVTEDNWYGQGEFRVKCYDFGQDWIKDSNDDLMVRSNWFQVAIVSVNDDAFIEKVSLTTGGTVDNDHQPITFTVEQGSKLLQDKKIYGRDNDTEDENNLVYTHNASTNAFRLKDNGQFSFLPRNEDVGETWVRVDIDDGNTPSPDDYCILKFKVTNRNDPPAITSVEWSDKGLDREVDMDTDEVTFRNVDEDYPVNLTLIALDPDLEIGQPESLTWYADGEGWKVIPHPSDESRAYLTYTPDNDDAIEGEASTLIRVTDSQSVQSRDLLITLEVDNINDRPEIVTVNGEPPVDGSISLNEENGMNGLEDEPFVITVVGNDVDYRDEVAFSINNPGFRKDVDIYDPMVVNFTIIPTQEMVGNHTVIVSISDRQNAKTSVRIDFQIVNTNDPPEAPMIRYEYPEGLLTETEIFFEGVDKGDPDGDPLTFIWDFGDLTQPVLGVEVNHSYAVEGTYTVTLTVRDPFGASAEKEMLINIIEKEIEVDPNLDTDEDGIPDWFENQYNELDAEKFDSDRDADGDGFTNLEEYLGEDGLPPTGPNDQNDDHTDPIDKNSHPPKEEEQEDFPFWYLALIAIVVVLLIIGIIVMFFLLTRKPKPVSQQMMYAPEQGLPPMAGGGQLPGVGERQQIGPQPQRQGLPPPSPPEGVTRERTGEQMEEQKEEESYLDGFMEDAKKEIEESHEQPEESNIWVPPAQEEDTTETPAIVDDLFSDEESEGGPEQEPPEEDDMPKPPQMPRPPQPPLSSG